MSISTEEKDRYLRETAIVLAREGFQTGKTDTGKLRGVHNFKCKGNLYGRTGGYAHD